MFISTASSAQNSNYSETPILPLGSKGVPKERRLSEEALIRVENLKTYFFLRRGVVKAVDGVSIEIKKGETLCLVGESGSGKTVTALSILRLIESPGRIVDGRITYRGENLLSLGEEKLRSLRGDKLAMIFQDPQTALNPVLTVGEQIMEPLMVHLQMTRNEARHKAIELLAAMGIPNASERVDYYPHQLSGGMRQRCMIAAALACSPEVLIADEPTSALDVTIQAQILELLKETKKKQEMSLLFITHDFGIVAELADSVAVMYAGKIIERGSVFEIFDSPAHPYTKALMNCLPEMAERGKLRQIPGSVPSLISPPSGCAFHPRCERAMEICRREVPREVRIQGNHFAACHRVR